MAWFLVQIIGIICGGIGMILTWIVTIMPQWRISVLAENNGLVNGRVDGRWISRWDGLWTTCVNQASISLQCNGYESMVSLTTDLKSGRVLMSFAVSLASIAFIFSLVGVLLTRCHEEGRQTRHCMIVTSGVLYIISAVLIIIPVGWTTSNIVRQAYDASVCRGAVRIEMGEALFLSWPTLVFILIGGIIMCWVSSCKYIKCCCDDKTPVDQEMVCMNEPEVRPVCRSRSRSEYI